MAKPRKIASFGLSVAIALLAIFAVVQFSSCNAIMNKTDELQAQTKQLSAQLDEAKATHEGLSEMKAKQEADPLPWRNAEGRLSLNGDGTGKVCYLTFDDGPSDALTPKILDILDEHDACGTWFCMGNKNISYLNLSLVKDIEKRGNAVGIHDWNQASDYDYYRGSVQHYFDVDFDRAKKNIEKAAGHDINIMRFAGGSPTIGYVNKNIGTSLPKEMIARGYQFFDWNVLAGDSEASQFVGGSTPKDRIVSNVLDGASYYAEKDSPICVLMHDNPGKDTTVEALPEIIEGLRDMGYEFQVLTYDSPGFYQVELS